MSGNANILAPNMNIDIYKLLEPRLVMMWLKASLEEINLDGKSGFKQMQKGGGIMV